MKQELTEQQKQILKLALQGYNYPEITQQLNIYGEIVEYFITQLRNPDSRYYNPDLYKKIKMEQHLRKYGTIDFDKIEEIQLLLTQGYCLFEIALYYQTKEETLRKRLYDLKIHGYITEDTYNFIKEKDKKIQKNSWFDIFTRLELIEKEGYDFKEYYHTDTYNRYIRYKTYRTIIWEFAINKTEIDAIANRTNYSVTTVKEILRNEKYLNLFPVEERANIKQALSNSFQKLSEKIQNEQLRINAHLYDTSTRMLHIKLKQIELNKDYYFKIIVTFRLSLPEFSKLTGLEFYPKLLYKNFMAMITSKTKKNALRYVFDCYSYTYPDENQKRLEEARAFDKKLKLAQFTKDKNTEIELLNILNDKKYREVYQKRVALQPLSPEDWTEIFKYRIKYALPYHAIGIEQHEFIEYLPKECEQENKVLDQFLQKNSLSITSKAMQRSRKLPPK